MGLNDIHCLSSFSIPKHELYRQAEILFLTSFRRGFSYMALPALTRNKPGVMTMHDIWPLTGHCAVSYDCDRWKTGCGRCPHLDVVPKVERDATRIEWMLKNVAYRRSHLTIVSRSTPITQMVKQSMLGRLRVCQIPGGVPADLLVPLERDQCRDALGIPRDKHVLMFAALSLSQPWKGADLLLSALDALPASLKKDTLLLLLGGEGEDLARSCDMPVVNLGVVMDEHDKAVAFSAADLFISPSRAEAFGLVALESMSCGTPSVAFAVGGAQDYVHPGRTGYLVRPQDTDGLRNGIVQLLEDDVLRSAMGDRGRELVLQEYTVELEVQRYLELFEDLLKN
jgi:glycosyltransferase involved in cell wall biosynthesis